MELTKFRTIDKDGKINLTEDGIIESIQSNFDLNLKSNLNNWMVPDQYLNLDIEKYLFDRCKTDIEKNRIFEELKLYKEKDAYIILKIMVYLSDFMKDNQIVCGVGRGSSCASYCLYLIGIHKIDSIKFNLDINEFLK